MSDFIYELGVDVRKADTGVQEFIKRTTEALDRLPVLTLKVNTGVALNSIKSFADTAKNMLREQSPTITARFDSTAARSGIQALNTELRNLSKGTDLSPTVSGLRNIGAAAGSGARAVRSQGDAFDYLGKTTAYSIMHLVEYMIIMRSLEMAAKEVANSFKLAAQVQLEQTLQGLYNKNVNLNQSLTASMVIAKQWGSNITDVQQVIGLWTKNTGDLSTAIYLANKAEELHRASGIETLEVYRTSIAMTEQLGLRLGQLPVLYDQIAEASLKMALPLKAIGDGNSQEGIKQLVEGVSETASTLKSLGFVTKSGMADTAAMVALVATQLEAASQNGKEVGKNISNMLAALEGAGKNRRNFEAIISGAKDADEVIDQMIARVKDLKQGLSDKNFSVKTQQFESLNNLLATLEKVKKLKADLVANSSGKLEIISEAEMATAIGQFDRLKSSVQIFSLTLGRQLLPNAQAFMNVLNTSWLPGLTKSVPLILSVASSLTRVGIGFVAFQGLARISALWGQFTTALQATIAMQSAASAATATQATSQATLASTQVATVASTGELTAANAGLLESTVALDAADATLLAEVGLLTEAEAAQAVAATSAAAATEALATAEGAAAVAGDAMAPSLLAVGSALGAMALSAVAALAPILAIIAAVDMAMGGFDALDARKNRNLGMDSIGAQGFDPSKGLHDFGQKQAINAGSPNPLDWITANGLNPFSDSDVGPQQQYVAASRKSQHALDSGLIEMLSDIQTGVQNEDLGKSDNGPSGQLVKALRHAGVEPASVQSISDLQAIPGIQGPLGDTLKGIENTKLATEDANKYEQDSSAAFKKQLAELTAGMSGLSKQLAPGATGEPPASALPGSEKGVASPQDVLGTSIKDTKTTAASIVSEQQEIQASYRATAQSLKDLGDVYGWTKKSVKELSDAYDGQIAAEKTMLAAEQAERSALMTERAKEVKQEASDKAGGPHKSKAYEADVRGLTQIDAAIRKTDGAVIQYTADLKLLQAEKIKALGTAQLDADLKGAGLGNNSDDVKKTVAEATRNLNLNTRASSYSDIIAAATATGVTLDGLRAKLTALLKAAKNPEEIKELKLLLQDVGDASLAAGDKVTQAGLDLSSLAESIQKIGESSANKNLDTLGELLGVNKADLDYVKAISDGLKEIADKKRELLSDADKIGDSNSAEADHARAMLDYDTQMLNLQQKLLVTYEQQKLIREQIQNSELYKATDEALTKTSTTALDLGIGKALDVSKKSSAFTDMLDGWLKSVLGDGLKKQIGTLTDNLFGVPKKVDDAALTKVYHDLVKSKLTSIDKTLTTIAGHGSLGAGGAGASGGENADFLNAAGINGISPLSLGNNPNQVDPISALLNMPPGSGLQILDDQGQPLADSIAASTQSDLQTQYQASMATDIGTLANSVSDTTSSSSPYAMPGVTPADAATGGGPTGTTTFSAYNAAKALGGAGGLLDLTELSGAKGATTIGERNVSTFGTIGTEFSALGAVLPKVQGPNGTMVASPLGQDLSRVGSGISGASEAIQGFQQGGLSGGVETGLGIFQTEAAINPALAASPVGIGIAAVGGLISGLIHHDNQADMPDKYMPGYGQGVANLQGLGYANGVHYQEDPSLQQELGGRDEIQAIEETLAAGRPSWMSQTEFSNLMSMFGASASGSGALTVGANLNQEKITGASGTSGQFFTPQQMDAAASQFAALFGANMNKTLAPILQFNVSGAYPGYTPNVNNLPGATAQEQAALRASQYGANSTNGTSIIPIVSNGGAYSTPGVGTSAPGATTTNPIYTAPAAGTTQPIQIQNTLYLDGQVVAQSVNNVNATTASRYGQVAA